MAALIPQRLFLIATSVTTILTICNAGLINDSKGKLASLAAQTCQNDGIPIALTECYCIGLYGGNDCGSILCANGGSPNGGQCTCPEGFTGIHCESAMCENTARVRYNSEHNNMVLIVRARKQIASLVDTVLSLVPDNPTCSPDYIQQYSVLAFNNNKTLLKTAYPTAFAARKGIKDLMSKATEFGGCQDTVLTQIINALQDDTLVNNRSSIYVISDALPSDTSLHYRLKMMNRYNIPIYYIMYYDDGCDVGLSPNGFFSLPQRALNEIIATSSGQVFDFTQDANGLFTELSAQFKFTAIRSSYVYGMYGCMYSYGYRGCSSLNPSTVVSMNNNSPSLAYVGTWFSGGQKSSLQSKLITMENVTTSTSAMVLIKGLPIGQNFFETNRTGNASRSAYRLYTSQNECSKMSTNNIFWGFSTAVNEDKSLVQPLPTLNLSMVIRMDGLEVSDPTQFSADLLIYQTEITNMKYMSNGIWRDDCTFQIYFAPFQCGAFMTYSFTLYVTDDNGNSIQRSGSMYCIPSFYMQCIHGALQEKVCVCDLGYTGADCSIPKCQNGAKLDILNNKCLCRKNYSGTFCENRGPEPATTTEPITTITTLAPSTAEIPTTNTTQSGNTQPTTATKGMVSTTKKPKGATTATISASLMTIIIALTVLN